MSHGWADDIQAARTPEHILICFSHLRWDFVYQRPQHLLTRAAAHYLVIYFEEPVFETGTCATGRLAVRVSDGPIRIATPVLPTGLDAVAVDGLLQAMLDEYLATLALPVAVAWFYTPMALGFAGNVAATTIVYDCMDELTLFKDASPRLKLLERRLLKRADLVFCGGSSLYQAKRHLHAHTYPFASSVDARHFAKARHQSLAEPDDQAALPHPRIGYFGVIDERMDYALLQAVCAARPDWSFIMLGPTAKVDPADLPQCPNLHWLGLKDYQSLPGYLSGWDVGMMPFARNASTRFISPTKTPEYLAAGVPLVSTSIPDVVTDWGDNGLVEIADDAAAFITAIERWLTMEQSAWLAQVDKKIAGLSWDNTWAQMLVLIQAAATGALKAGTDWPAHAH